MKSRWNIALLLALVSAVIAVGLKVGEVENLRGQIVELKRERLKLLQDQYDFSWVVPDAAQKKDLELIYADMVAAYTNGDVLAMKMQMSRLPKIHYRLQWQAAHGVAAAFSTALNKSFLCPSQLRDFTDVEEFERYLLAGPEATRFYGEADIRRRSFDFPVGVEYLALMTLKKYCKKFNNAGHEGLEKVAQRYLEYWIARIESTDGLTRQCAWHTFNYHTLYLRVVKPESALTDAQGVLLARQTASGLIHCGYTPKWLDEEFPLPPKDDTGRK